MNEKNKLGLIIPILIAVICLFIVTSGCLQDLPGMINPDRLKSATDSGPGVNESDENQTQQLAQARSAIRTFTGIPDLDLKYTGTDHGTYNDFYDFTSEHGEFLS